VWLSWRDARWPNSRSAFVAPPSVDGGTFAGVATVLWEDFEWDDLKAIANERKHGVTFEEAATVFEDVDHLVNADPANPSRFVAVGFSRAARVLVVVHLSREERFRLISARRATLKEESLYAERRGR
jgi:uncharacterized protein